MKPTEILQALERLAQQPFDRGGFVYDFLRAFGNKDTTLKRLKADKGGTNKTDIRHPSIHAVLQIRHVHMATCAVGQVSATLRMLRNSKATQTHKVKFILATDGTDFQGEHLHGAGNVLACAFKDLGENFNFLMPLAGISNVKHIADNPLDIKATVRLNRLYLELLKHNPDWGKGEGIAHMNHFMAQLIFCFFAEDTNIFMGEGLFTDTVRRFSTADGANTADIIAHIFKAMDIPTADRRTADIPRYANSFPYVNGGLFGGMVRVPKFTKTALTYLQYVGGLDWRSINPDIFGSMIQSIADADERTHIGMHYTSVPNILKCLNPLFLDDLWDSFYKAGDNQRKLLNLKKRLCRIRVFDPACGSGNFLVIAYKELRKMEFEINKKRGESRVYSAIPLNNFRGIELRDFSAEIAKIALIITEYQCDVQYLGEKMALNEFLPLKKENWITQGNALRYDWLDLCPPTGKSVKLKSDDLFETPLDQAEIDFKNMGGETYICGNPPYLGARRQSKQQKSDMKWVFERYTKNYKSLDYVCAWFMKAAEYGTHTPTKTAFVATNSMCQGEQVATLWKPIFTLNHHIIFAHTSFKWSNLASHNAGVMVVIVGISNIPTPQKRLFFANDNKESIEKLVDNINAYLIPSAHIIIDKISQPISAISPMLLGNAPVDGGHLLLTKQEISGLDLTDEQEKRFIRPIYGSAEFIKGKMRYCIWITKDKIVQAMKIPSIAHRVHAVKEMRLSSKAPATQQAAQYPYYFIGRSQIGNENIIVIPRITSENREYLPCGILPIGTIITDANFGLFDAPLWNMALIVSKMHRAWIDTICGKLETRIRYSNTLGWNTFPVPKLTTDDKHALTESAEAILMARELHFPKTIADLYDPKTMPENLRHAHQQNDQIIDRIFAGKLFETNTERLEHLFTRYKKLTEIVT